MPDWLAILKSQLDKLVPGDHREKIYPWDSVGVTVVAGDVAWGGVAVLIPVNTLDTLYGWGGGGEIVAYNVVGLFISSETDPANTNTIQLLRVPYATETALDATSGAGEANPDRIQVANTSKFLVGDTVWVKDDVSPNGELGTVESIVTDDYLDLVDNLANAYTVAQNAKVYLAHRVDGNAYRAMWAQFSWDSTKNILAHRFHAVRKFGVGDGLIVRAYGIEGDSSMRVTTIYDDYI